LTQEAGQQVVTTHATYRVNAANRFEVDWRFAVFG
jgi:hypothetical protein